MIGIFSRTTGLYNALADETRLSILILARAKEKMELREFMKYLGEKSEETLENHLNILEKVNLVQKRDTSYSLTKEGIRRLTEFGVTESEAMELVKERETSLEMYF
jgi:DNA-binding HxlR family transcriptional regulator